MSIITEKNRKWWGLASIMPALAMIFTDQSVLPVALPTIQKNFAATNIELEWMVNSYLLLTAVLILSGGKIGDRIGYRKAFILGIIIFAAASALCGFSPTASFLIFARALQGIGAALMMPASTALLVPLFPPSERGKAMGINVSASSLFLIIAPIIGGYFTQSLSWRWIFWINLPLAALGIVFSLLFLPKSVKGQQKFDVPGFTFFAIFSSLLVIILMQGRTWGWLSGKTLLLLLICVIAAFFLFWRERKAKHPFLEISLFKHNVFKAVNISIFATQFILMISVFRTIYFQDILAWSPMKTGIITVISSCPVLFISPIAGYLSDKFGPKLPIAIGLTVLTYSFFWTAFFNLGPTGWLIPGLMAFGVGIPLILTPSFASAMSSVPPTKAGIASGTLGTNRALAGCLGVAALGSFIENIQFSSFRSLVQEDTTTSDLSPTFLEKVLVGKEHAKEALSTLSGDIVEKVQFYYRESQIDGFFYSHVAVGLFFIAAFAFVFVLYNRKSSHHLPETPAEGWD